MILKLKKYFGSNAHFKEIVKGSVLTFFAKILATGFGLISSLIVARYYGADIVGIVALINSVITIFGVFALLGSNTAILRLIPEYVEKFSIASAYSVYKKVFSIVIFASIVCGIILFCLSNFIVENIFQKEYMYFFLMLAAPFLIIRSMVEFNAAALRGLQKINLFALTQLLPSIISLILLIVLTIFFYDEYNPVYVIYASGFITALIIVYMTFSLFKKLIVFDTKCVSITTSGLLSLSFPMFLTASMHLVISQTDTVMLGMMRSEAEVGVYAIVLKLALLTSFILTAINTMAAPKFSQLFHAGKMEDLKTVAQQSSQLIFWTTLPLILLYVFVGYYILYIFGESFTGGYYALVFLSIGQFVNAMAGSVGFFLNMTGNERMFQKIVFFGATLNIVLNLIFIPLYGINGAAISSMVSVSIWNIMSAIYVKKRFGFFISYIPFSKKWIKLDK